MSQTPKLDEVIEAGIDQRLENFITTVPARVTKFNDTSGLVDIVLLANNAVQGPEGNWITQKPNISNVPVIFPGNGTDFRVTVPVKAGDFVLYIVSSFEYRKWLATGSPVVLVGGGIESRNHITSGFAIPGLFNLKSSRKKIPTDAIVLEGKTKIGGDTDTEPTFKADKFMKHFNNFLDVLAFELDSFSAGSLGTSIKEAWAIASNKPTGSDAPSGVKTTLTEVK